MKIKISKVAENLFVPEYVLDNGYVAALAQCESEAEARAMVMGFRLGMNAVKNMIGVGIDFDAKIYNAESP